MSATDIFCSVFIVVISIPTIFIIGLVFRVNIWKFLITWGKQGKYNPIRQQFTNDKERECNNPDCSKVIKVGEEAIRETKFWGDPVYYHKRCCKRK